MLPEETFILVRTGIQFSQLYFFPKRKKLTTKIKNKLQNNNFLQIKITARES
jgi:hypothetical protein